MQARRLSSLSITELRDIAKEVGITEGLYGTSKQAMILKINQARLAPVAPAKQTPAATIQYWATLDELKAQLSTLQDKIGRHEQKQAKHPGDYGYAGDLGHILQLVQQANSFLNV